MKGMIKKKKGEASWITFIKKRIDSNLNFLAITTGGPGAGKSYADLSISHQLDPEFNPEYQVAFDFPSFMKIINRFNGVDTSYFEDVNESEDEEEVALVPRIMTPLHKRKYKVIVFEESQTAVNRREWQSKANKMFLYLMSTFRHQNIIVLFNMPYQDYFDSSSMKLIHAKFESKGWSKKTKKTYLRPLLLQYNDKLSKFYEHNLFVIQNNRAHKFAGLWGVPKASKQILESYERMKEEFTFKLNAKMTKEIMQNDEPNDRPIETRKLLTKKQEEIMRTLANIKESNRYEVCSKMLGLSTNAISCRRKGAEKKGYRLEEFENDE